MAETRPIGEQLRFLSQNTGEHILDDYLEASEKGGRTVPDLLGDLFATSDGVFRSDVFQFREDPADPGMFQVRVGQFVNADTGWQTITFTDFHDYVADALSYKNAAELAKTQAENARDDALPVINNITDVLSVAGRYHGCKHCCRSARRRGKPRRYSIRRQVPHRRRSNTSSKAEGWFYIHF